MKRTSVSLLSSLFNFFHALYILVVEPIHALLGKQSKKFAFASKTCWITGASSGIGRALAIRCAGLGANLVLSSRSKRKLEEVAAICKEINENCRVLVYPVDLSEYTRADEFVGGVTSGLNDMGLDGIDALFNVAGVSSRGAVLSSSAQTDKSIMDINFFSPTALTRAALPCMIRKGGGQVVTVSSVQGKIAIPFRSSYSASKHAVQGFFDSLRAEVHESNVKVLVVSPGYVSTDLSLNALNGDGTKYGVVDASTANGMKAESLAALITDAVERGEKELIEADFHTELAIHLRSAWPELFSAMMAKRALKQRPQSVAAGENVGTGDRKSKKQR